MALLCQFFAQSTELQLFHDRLGPGRWKWGNHIMALNLVAVYHEVDHCMKCSHLANVRIFCSQPAEGAAVLWTSYFYLFPPTALILFCYSMHISLTETYWNREWQAYWIGGQCKLSMMFGNKDKISWCQVRALTTTKGTQSATRSFMQLMMASWHGITCLVTGPIPGIILCMHPAIVTSSLSGLVHTQNDPCPWRALQWRHNEHEGFSNHQPHDCLLNHLFGCRSKNTWKLCVTGLCAGNLPGTGEFPPQLGSNRENVSIRWRHHEICQSLVSSTHKWLKVRNVDVIFDDNQYKLLNKHLGCWWFEIPWCLCDITVMNEMCHVFLSSKHALCSTFPNIKIWLDCIWDLSFLIFLIFSKCINRLWVLWAHKSHWRLTDFVNGMNIYPDDI